MSRSQRAGIEYTSCSGAHRFGWPFPARLRALEEAQQTHAVLCGELSMLRTVAHKAEQGRKAAFECIHTLNLPLPKGQGLEHLACY